MSETHMKPRGSALVSVILVLLVLTIVGVGIAYFTSMEDRLSGNTRIAKAGFYAADAGLRRGEALLNKIINMPQDPCVPAAQRVAWAASPLRNDSSAARRQYDGRRGSSTGAAPTPRTARSLA